MTSLFTSFRHENSPFSLLSASFYTAKQMYCDTLVFWVLQLSFWMTVCNHRVTISLPLPIPIPERQFMTADNCPRSRATEPRRVFQHFQPLISGQHFIVPFQLVSSRVDMFSSCWQLFVYYTEGPILSNIPALMCLILWKEG